MIPGFRRSPGEGKGYTAVFWPGEFHGLYSHKESLNWNMAEVGFKDMYNRIIFTFINWLISLSIMHSRFQPCCTMCQNVLLLHS